MNRSAEFTGLSTTDRSIAENTPAGANVGDPVAARDREDDTLTYSLRGADAESFDIDPATGQLLTKAPLDYEAKDSYSVIVSVSDGKSSSGRESDTRDDSITVTITLTDVDSGPYDTNKNEAIERDEAIAALVDYFSGAITQEEAIAVIQLYFAG